jgi:hypothetical protein
LIAGAAVAVAVTGAVSAASDSGEATAAAAPAGTVPVERGDLASAVAQDGILAYRARPDGSPYTAINQARGIFTKLPAEGDKVACGEALYRVDDDPVLLLCGKVPAYRDLRRGDRGRDVRQLNRNLHVAGGRFTAKTKKALERLQRRRGMAATGTLDLGDAVFLPRPARIAKVSGRLGAPARPGAPVVQATSDRLEVHVNLDATQRGAIRRGDRAQVTLPDNTVVRGRVDRLATVADTAGQDGPATVPASIRLAAPRKARGFDQAPVRVEISTEGVKRVLSVPVIALVGKSGGGFAVEVVRDGGRRELVAVRLGLVDSTSGRVEVTGALGEGDRVVVPSP